MRANFNDWRATYSCNRKNRWIIGGRLLGNLVWAMPTFAPTFEQVAAQLEPKARFIKIETEKEQAISAKYDIRSIPTLAIFKNGKEVDRVSGALNAPDFTNWVYQYL